MIKLLIVEDSALMRRHLVNLFEAEGDFRISTCRNGKEALQELEEFEPDVITLDINMPEMDGLTCLSHIMVKRPTPVIMVSSLTEKGALATFEALNMGAIDYVAKPGGTISLNIEKVGQEIVKKVRTAAKAKLRSVKGLTNRIREANAKAASQPAAARRARTVSQSTDSHDWRIVLIGVSTGGPRTLEEILPFLPEDYPYPIVVCQHMPASFTQTFAQRMNDLCPLEVLEVTALTPVTPGKIYIARGGGDLIFSRRTTGLMLLPKPESSQYLWHPSVELMVRSALDCHPPEQLIGVMLTGMGYDGADAMTEVRKRGGRCIAESEASAVVFGMPAELIARGGADIICRSDEVARHLNRWAQ